MKKTPTILLAVRTLSYQGGKILGNRWLPLVDALRQSLARSGFEQAGSSDELLLFTFPNPFLALTSLLESLERVKWEHGWQESHGALPVQAVIHLIEDEDPLPQIQQTGAGEWDLLQQESIHITRPLMKKWKELTAGRALPEHRFEDEGGGFFQIVFAGKATVAKVELFSYRGLPVRGKLKECFYCGMTSHGPADCPSKFLPMQVRGLDQVGYLTFDELNAIYKKIFPDYSACQKKCAAGIKPGQLRKDPELLVFVAYFDINLMYQLRFLANTAFCLNARWEAQWSSDNLNIDSRNLHLGLDCLRVGQYERAENLLAQESKRQGGKQFHALIGLAFWALEQGRLKDMAHYLEKAKNVAAQEKERLYCHLLLSRYYELQNDAWTAKESINNAIKINFDALECQYRKIQLNVRYGFDETDHKRLRSLMLGQKEIFMTALLDPLLLPVQGLANDLAIEHIQYQRAEAAKLMALAEEELAELKWWYAEQEQAVAENYSALNQVQQQFKRESYYDFLDVIERAKAIAGNCLRARKSKIEEIEARKSTLETTLHRYQNFWDGYEYKRYFNSFQQSLVSVVKTLHEAQALIATQHGQEYRAAVNLLDQVEHTFSALLELQEKMLWTRLVLNGLKLYVKKMVIAELALFAAGFAVFMLLPLALHETGAYPELYRMANSPSLQKKSMLIAALFLVPLISLIWTVWQLKDER
jgi:hypothetical protein